MATLLSTQRDHRPRFLVLLVALGVILAGAIVATVVLAQRDRPAPWSDFTAVDDDPVARAMMIGDHVQGLYHDDAGQPLTVVTAGEDMVNTISAPAQTVAVAADAKGAPVSFEQQNILFYRLCGPLPDCGFGSGDVTRELTVSSRQAQELALRGFKDVPEATAVMAIMPPGFLEMTGPVGEQPDTVLYFRRSDLSGELDRPLRETVPAPVAPAKLTDAAVSVTRDALVPALFSMRSHESSDGTGVIYQLTPPPNG